MKRLNVLLVAFAATCMSAFADDVVSVNINPTTPSPGDEFAIEVLFDNSEGLFNGAQFEIHMPEGIAPVIESVWNDDDEEYKKEIKVEKGALCKSGHSIKAIQLTDGGEGFVIVDATNNSTFKARKDAVAKVYYKISETLPAGEYTGKISGRDGIELSKRISEEEFEVVLLKDVEFKIQIVPTKINGLVTGKTVKVSYNVAGQQTDGIQKGINIIEGKKVMVK